MYHYSHYQKMGILLTVVLAAVALSLFSSEVSAYITGSKWQNATFMAYGIDPYLDSLLSRNSTVTGAAAQVDSATAKWNSSRFTLLRDDSQFPNGNIVSAYDFEVIQPCPVSDPTITRAVNCLTLNSTTLFSSRIYFNRSGRYVWNTSGNVTCGSDFKDADVLATAAHEFGHSYFLGDNPPGHPEAIMDSSAACNYRPNLAEDDKHGATLLYGIRTGWEDGFALGETNTWAYRLNVSGYDGGPNPELGRRGVEFGATPVSGSWMELLAGNATSSYSYAYMRLFTSASDSGTQRNYLRIAHGMRLKWYQYNYQQRTMSVDFRMTDGSTLRDSGLTTTSGLPTHPAWRHNSPTRQWFFNEVDLTPLNGKVIDQWMVAYDNSQTGWQYVFRAYFDNVRVEY